MGLVQMRPEPGSGSGGLEGTWVPQPGGAWLFVPADSSGPRPAAKLVVVTGRAGWLRDAVAKAFKERQAEEDARLAAERAARAVHRLAGEVAALDTVPGPDVQETRFSGPVDGTFTLVDDTTTMNSTVTSSRRAKASSKKTSSPSASPSSSGSSSSGSSSSSSSNSP